MTVHASLAPRSGTVTLHTDGGSFDLTPEQAHALALNLLAEVQAAPAPALKVDGDHTVCPHCGHRVEKNTDKPAVIERDYDTRENAVSIGQGEQNYETVAFACASCRKFVDLPNNTFDVDWS